MSNIITIELSAEDRARMDNLTAALIANGRAVEALYKQNAPVTLNGVDDVQKQLAAAMAKASTTTEAPEEATEAPEASTPPVTQPEEENPTEEAEAPTVTLEQIQQKVVQLAAGFNGTKKAQVKEIINAYGAKVSDLKDKPEVWTEVWNKLTALESEG
jgi:hypothetical protein